MKDYTLTSCIGSRLLCVGAGINFLMRATQSCDNKPIPSLSLLAKSRWVMSCTFCTSESRAVRVRKANCCRSSGDENRRLELEKVISQFVSCAIFVPRALVATMYSALSVSSLIHEGHENTRVLGVLVASVVDTELSHAIDSFLTSIMFKNSKEYSSIMLQESNCWSLVTGKGCFCYKCNN